MPVIKSAKKALRRDRRRNQVNAKTRRKMKQAVKVAAKNPTAKNLSAAYRMVDRAAKKGVVHKNRAARLKSRLAKQLKEAKVTKVTKVKKVTPQLKKKTVIKRKLKKV